MTLPLREALLAGLLLAPAVTAAQVTLGARAGMAFPLGDLERGAAVKEAVERAYPIEAAVGWKLTPSVEVGLQGGYAFASQGGDASRECAVTGSTCKVHLWNVGARGEYEALAGSLRPFAAATLGWEWEVERWKVRPDDWDQTSRSGWLAGLEAGAYLPATKKLDLGAFVGLSFGQFLWKSEKGETLGEPHADAAAIASPALHGWLSIGLRGRFTL
ncbi:MAG: hypothetical protein WCC48_07285 [Anaeromyxobacteraceae bacterium]